MNQERTGALIRRLRIQAGYTQSELAERIGVTDKAVSKWETGVGMPDIGLISRLGEVFSVRVESLLSGEMNENKSKGGSMKNTMFAICPVCGGVYTLSGNAQVSCCGRVLRTEQPRKATAEEKLTVEPMEDEWYISSDHPMTKENYIHFVALVTGERLTLVRQYPEWDLSLRLPGRGHGKLVWYADDTGLLYQLVSLRKVT